MRVISLGEANIQSLLRAGFLAPRGFYVPYMEHVFRLRNIVKAICSTKETGFWAGCLSAYNFGRRTWQVPPQKAGSRHFPPVFQKTWLATFHFISTRNGSSVDH